LSAIELAQLQTALETLLSPFDYVRIGAWRRRVRHTVQALLGADSSVSLLQIPGEPAFDTDDFTPLAEYGASYHRFDRVDQYRDLGTVAFIWRVVGHLWERPSPAAWLASEFYNDWVVRNHLCQPRGLNLALPAGQLVIGPPQGEDVAALYFYQNAERPAIDAERQLVLLRTLLPAFRAGTYLALRVGTRGNLADLVGTLSEGVVLLDERARVVYENPAFRELLAGDPDGARIERECVRAGRLVLTLAAAQRPKSCPEEIIGPRATALRSGTAAYRLRSALVGPGVLDIGPMALLVLERTTPTGRLLERFRTRFRLTPRELAVSRLLAEGRSNEEVARLLGVSIHTARRHVEHVLMKLGVHSRAAVGATLREERPDLRRDDRAWSAVTTSSIPTQTETSAWDTTTAAT